MTMMASGLEHVSVLVPAFNEEANIACCLESVQGARVVFVLDSHSTDSTREIAESLGASVYMRRFDDYATNKNWALSELPWPTDWVLLLDADESVTPELREEIAEVVTAEPKEVCYSVRRKFMWMGKWLKHGGCYPNWAERLFRRDKVRYEARTVNERLIVDGKSGFLRWPLIHDDRRGLAAWLHKHNRYSTMEAEEALRGLSDGQVRPRLSARDPIARKRFIMHRIWPLVPFKPLAFFVYQYFFRLGFLDGAPGYHYARLKSQFVYWTELKRKELLRERRMKQRGN
jgi:glycosyltransferase involved in cell wall biosynthesis